ncbi:MAG TPA: hypothetical protein VFU81_18205 [Thermomicrobiales bacterium]|nr:hypothetical protein [Thermomicrobiales bacterium]
MPNGAACHIANARLLPLAAVFVLLLLPVDLRAGLPAPHPHALFQIIDDAADGAIDHDHDAVDQGYGVHHHDHALAPAPRGADAPDLPHVAADDSGVGSGPTAALPPIPLPHGERALARQAVEASRAALFGVAPRPPIPPPRSTA